MKSQKSAKTIPPSPRTRVPTFGRRVKCGLRIDLFCAQPQGEKGFAAVTNPVTGCELAQTEVAGNEKHDDDETDQPDDLIHCFSP